MSKNKLLFSIIIPVYNIESYIGECIDSVKNQTLKSNWECLIFNDGSTDNSLTVVMSLIKNDSRFKLINQKNMGLSAVKNLGISMSKGDYLVFIDGDDLINDNYLFELSIAIKKTSADIISPFVIQHKIKPKFESIYTKDFNLYHNMKAKEFAFNPKNYGSSWSMICKRNLFKGLEFPDSIFEDSFLLPLLIDKINSLCKVKGSIYWYRIRKGSIMNSNKKKSWYILKSKSHLVILNYLKNNNINISYSYRYMQFLHTFIEMSRLKYGIEQINQFKRLPIPSFYFGKYTFKFIFLKIFGVKILFFLSTLLKK